VQVQRFADLNPATAGLASQTDVVLMLAQALADAVFYRDPPMYCPACDV
jgi:hypothetical protein